MFEGAVPPPHTPQSKKPKSDDGPIMARMRDIIHQLYPDYYWNGASAKPAKDLIKTLRFKIRHAKGAEATDGEIIEWFGYTMHNLPDFYRRQFNMRLVYNNIESIMNLIAEETGRVMAQAAQLQQKQPYLTEADLRRQRNV